MSARTRERRHSPDAELIHFVTTYAKHRPTRDEALARALGASRRDLIGELVGLRVVVVFVDGATWHGRFEAVDDRAALVGGFVIPLAAIARIGVA